jgi:hypothetical protein
MGVSDYNGAIGAPDSSHDFAGVDELISDLTALLDAGLVVVHEHVLGPPRYGVAPGPDTTAGRGRRVVGSRVGIMHG